MKSEEWRGFRLVLQTIHWRWIFGSFLEPTDYYYDGEIEVIKSSLVYEISIVGFCVFLLQLDGDASGGCGNFNKFLGCAGELGSPYCAGALISDCKLLKLSHYWVCSLIEVCLLDLRALIEILYIPPRDSISLTLAFSEC